MNRDQKSQVVDRIAGEIQQSDAILALDYRGISVKQAAELRAALADADASFRIVKNTLTELAADKAGAPTLKDLLEGPTALTFVRGDVALAAKAIATFRRREGILEIKGGQLEGETLSVEQIDEIGRLPARDVLHGQFVGVLASPLTTLVRGLASMISGLAVALRQIEEQGLVGGAGAPPTEDAPAGAADAPAETPAEPVADAEAPGAETEAPAEAETPAGAEAPAQSAAEAEAEAPAEPAAETDASAEPAAEADEPAEAEAPAEAPAPADTEESVTQSEAPGDPVAEAEAAEETSESTPSEGGSESEEG